MTQAVAVRRERTPVINEAVRRAQAGDPDAFATVYQEHAPRVFALCLRMCGDRVRAAELLQDVFVRAWEKLANYRGEAAFGTWLHRLAVNVVLGEYRSGERRVFEELDEATAPAAGGGSPESKMDLETAIAKLPRGARSVLVLHDIEGYEHAEIGAMMGIAEGTSKAHLFRARRLLREALDQ